MLYPGETGVTIHKPGTIKIAMTEAKLWAVSAKNKTRKEWANNVYNYR